MRKKMYWEWESLDEKTSRIMVIGGWIVKDSKSMVFISDRDHEWTIIAKPTELKVVKNPVSEGY